MMRNDGNRRQDDVPLADELPLEIVALDDALAGPSGDIVDGIAELSPGVVRALGAIAMLPAESIPMPQFDAVSRVAESRAPYQTARHAAGMDLLTLAARRGISMRELAERTALSPQLVLWLHRGAHTHLGQCHPLVRQLAGALGASSIEVVHALEQPGAEAPNRWTSEGIADDLPFSKAIEQAASLEEWRRAYWQALLNVT